MLSLFSMHGRREGGRKGGREGHTDRQASLLKLRSGSLEKSHETMKRRFRYEFKSIEYVMKAGAMEMLSFL